MQEMQEMLVPGSGRSLGGGNGNPFQYSFLGNPMDRGASWATVHRVSKDLDMTEHSAHAYIKSIYKVYKG